jgi:hypothetical protein
VTEAYTETLQPIIDEFKTISPETTNTLIFEKDGKVVANTKETTEDQTKILINNFNIIAAAAETIGEIENLTIQGADSQLNITSINRLYLATVSSRTANPEIVKSLTQVMVPTVVRLIDQIASQPEGNQLPEPFEIEEKPIEKMVLPVEEETSIEPSPELEPSYEDQIEDSPIEETNLPVEDEPSIKSSPEPEPSYEDQIEENPIEETVLPVEDEPTSEPQPSYEPLLPATPVNQFMVEKIGGLLVHSDTVRIDGEVLANWIELYDGKNITMVEIEALDGKKTTCKFKPIKDGKNSSKGIIQIPEKILQALEIEKGKLVMVKPVIE